MGLAGLILSILGLVLFIIFVVAGGNEVGVPELRLWDSLRLGQCVNDLNELQAEVVPCAVPHEAEAFAVLNDPEGVPADYAGRSELREVATVACQPRFGDYVGVDYEGSRLVIRPVVPPQALWEGGRRWVVCLVERGGAGYLRDSVRHSGR